MWVLTVSVLLTEQPTEHFYCVMHACGDWPGAGSICSAWCPPAASCGNCCIGSCGAMHAAVMLYSTGIVLGSGVLGFSAGTYAVHITSHWTDLCDRG